MTDTKQPVETKVETAGTPQEVKTEVQPASTEPEVDYVALVDTITKQEQELAKERIEKENYRKGMLKAKGKLPDDDIQNDTSNENIDEMIDRKVEEKLFSAKELNLQAQKDKAFKDMAKKVSELTTALRNRGQIASASSAQGANQDKNEVADTFFSAEQLTALKARGYDDAKIETLKANMKKAKEIPVIIK